MKKETSNAINDLIKIAPRDLNLYLLEKYPNPNKDVENYKDLLKEAKLERQFKARTYKTNLFDKFLDIVVNDLDITKRNASHIFNKVRNIQEPKENNMKAVLKQYHDFLNTLNNLYGELHVYMSEEEYNENRENIISSYKDIRKSVSHNPSELLGINEKRIGTLQEFAHSDFEKYKTYTFEKLEKEYLEAKNKSNVKNREIYKVNSSEKEIRKETVTRYYNVFRQNSNSYLYVDTFVRMIGKNEIVVYTTDFTNNEDFENFHKVILSKSLELLGLIYCLSK